MSSSLSKALRAEHKVRSLPIRKGDVVKIVRGDDDVKGKEAKVVAVYRKKFCIHIENLTRQNAKAVQKQIPIHPSNVVITTLYTNGNRMDLIARKSKRALKAIAHKAKTAKA